MAHPESTSIQITLASPQPSSSLSSHRQPYPLSVSPSHPYPSTAAAAAAAAYPTYTGPADDYGPSDVKDTQLVSPSYDNAGLGYLPNGTVYSRARSPVPPSSSGGAYHLSGAPSTADDTATLSTFLHSMFLSAKNATANSTSYLTPSASDASLPYLNQFLAGPPPSHPNGNGAAKEASGTLTPGWMVQKVPPANTLGFIALCSLWYISSALSSNTGKSILTRFRYPVTLTFVQFAFVAGYCVLFLSVREQFANAGAPPSLVARRGSLSTTAGWGIRKPSRSMFQGTLVMSLFQIAGHVFSSMAIARVPVSTVHTIKALSPLFTVASYAVLFRVRYSAPTYVALGPLTLGVMLACSFDFRANAVGFLCALGSTVIFVSQNIFSKKLLPKDGASATSGGKLDKLNLLFYSSGMAFFLMIPIWLYSDGSALFSVVFHHASPLHAPTSPQTSSTASLVYFFFLNGTVHFAQNLLAFSILARTSPVTYSIASLIKRIAVICLAIVWSGQAVSLVQALGMALTFSGLWMYNRAKGDVDKGEKKRQSVERRGDLFLPSTLADLSGATTPIPLYAQSAQQPLLPTTQAPPASSGLGLVMPPHAGTDAESVYAAPHAGMAEETTKAVMRKGSTVGPPPSSSSQFHHPGSASSGLR